MSCKKSPFLKRRVLVPPQVTDLTNVSDNKLMFYQHVMQHSIIFPWGVWEFLLTENTRDFKIQFRKLWQRLLWKSQNFDSLLQLASYERIWSQNQVKKELFFKSDWMIFHKTTHTSIGHVECFLKVTHYAIYTNIILIPANLKIVPIPHGAANIQVLGRLLSRTRSN